MSGYGCPQCGGEHVWESCRELQMWADSEERIYASSRSLALTTEAITLRTSLGLVAGCPPPESSRAE